MSHTFSDPDLAELDRIWPLGRQLVVPENGCIVVAGAYEGRYMRYIGSLFPTANLVGFEPQTGPWSTASASLVRSKDAIVCHYGLGTANRKMQISDYGTDGASFVGSGVGPCEIYVRDIVEVIHALVRTVDLFVMNIEGSEWSLIPYMLDEMMHHRITSMAIQFHEKYVSKKRRDYVLDYLDQYYDRTYWDYPNWCYFLRKG